MTRQREDCGCAKVLFQRGANPRRPLAGPPLVEEDRVVICHAEHARDRGGGLGRDARHIRKECRRASASSKAGQRVAAMGELARSNAKEKARQKRDMRERVLDVFAVSHVWRKANRRCASQRFPTRHGIPVEEPWLRQQTLNGVCFRFCWAAVPCWRLPREGHLQPR